MCIRDRSLALHITYRVAGLARSFTASHDVVVGQSISPTDPNNILDTLLRFLNQGSGDDVTWSREGLVIRGVLRDTTDGNTFAASYTGPLTTDPVIATAAGTDDQTSATISFEVPEGPSTGPGTLNLTFVLDRPGTTDDRTEAQVLPLTTGVTGSDITDTLVTDLNAQWAPAITWTRTGAGARTVIGTSQAEGAGTTIRGTVDEFTFPGVTGDITSVSYTHLTLPTIYSV